MSRSGYSDDCDGWALIRWRGAVNSAIKGQRGQAFLREIIAALDALPEKRLVANDLEANGQFCTLGAVGNARGTPLKNVDPDDRKSVADLFNISEALAAEIMYENDDSFYTYSYEFVDIVICGPMRGWESHTRSVRQEIPAKRMEEVRWNNMRNWALRNLAKETPCQHCTPAA